MKSLSPNDWLSIVLLGVCILGVFLGDAELRLLAALGAGYALGHLRFGRKA